MATFKLRGTVSGLRRVGKTWRDMNGRCTMETAGWIATISASTSRLSTSFEIPVEHGIEVPIGAEVEITVTVKP